MLNLCTNDGPVGLPGAVYQDGEDQSGATAVQVVWSSRQRSPEIEHIGSAQDERELKAAARQRGAGGQLEVGLGA